MTDANRTTDAVVPAKALDDLIRAYVRLMEAGRDRIMDLGGTCDGVDVMERGDPWLNSAKATLAAAQPSGASEQQNSLPSLLRGVPTHVVLDVAEIPGRDSPDDQPEMMLVTGPELAAIVANRINAAIENAARSGEPHGEHGEAIDTACDILGRECNHIVNGRCDTRACMAKLANDPRKIEIPPRFVGCEYLQSIRALQAIPRSGEPCGLPAQRDVLDWAVRSFGPIAQNVDERAARVAEEAIEIAQVEGVPLETIKRIADRVYSRPPGDRWQEIGGTMIGILAYAEIIGLSVAECARREFQRVLSKPREWWQKKHAEKVAAGTADLSPTKGGVE